MKIKKYISILMILAISINIFGCKRKAVEEAAPSVMYTEDQYFELMQQVNQLKDELALYDGKYQTQTSFKTKSVIQAGNWTYNKIHDKIVLDEAIWAYTDGFIKPAGLQGNIKMGDKIIIKTPDNWKMQVKTDSIDCMISNNVYGSIKFMTMDGGLPEDTKVMLDTYFSTNNLKQLYTDKEIFIRNDLCGYENSANIEIQDSTLNGESFTIPAYQITDISEILNYDSDTEVDVTIQTDPDVNKNATLRVGVICYRNLIINYKFLELNSSGTRNALDLIQNIYYENNNVYVK